MTSSQSTTFSAIPSPYAEDGDRNVISDVASDTVVNKVNGIPEVFSKEISTGGKYIQRNDLNGLGHLLSLFQYYMQVHSVVRFDQSVCDQIGGYPQGSILAYVDDSSNPAEMFFIESNNENNTVVPVPGSTIDDGRNTTGTYAWHKLTPSWKDLLAMDFSVEVVDTEPSSPKANTYYFIRGEGITLNAPSA